MKVVIKKEDLMTIELSNAELNVIRHALSRLQMHNKKLLNPVMYKKFYEGIYSKEQFDRAELEMDYIEELMAKIPTRKELEES